MTTAIKFLATVANSVHHGLFATDGVLQNVCEKIIAPNVQLLTQDEELFDDNPFEYVRRDVEGSDTDTRRRVSCELVRALSDIPVGQEQLAHCIGSLEEVLRVAGVEARRPA